MTVNDYITQRFSSFGVQLTQADLLDMAAGLDGGDEAKKHKDKLSVAIARFIPSLLARATSVSESGFSMSWNIQGIKDYYSYLCRLYGLKNDLDTDSAEVTFIQ